MGKIKSFFSDFKSFITKGNILSMAVGVVIGAAFSAIVNAVVNNILMPIVTLAVPGGLEGFVTVLNPDKALERRNIVLTRMKEKDYLSRTECDSLKQLPINLHTRIGDRTTGVGPYFRDMLRRTMSADRPRRKNYETAEDYRVDSLQWADDPLYGWLNKNLKNDGTKYDLDKDGLRIYTTINYKMQRYAEEAIAEHLGGNLQKAFWRELKNRRNAPFANDTEAKVVDVAMNQARRWSDRTRMMKASGYSDAESSKSRIRATSAPMWAVRTTGISSMTMSGRASGRSVPRSSPSSTPWRWSPA